MKVKTLVLAIVGGTLIALLTGLFQGTPPMLVGAVWYGYPLAWLFELVVAPQYYPWMFNFVNLAIDIIFWAIIVGILVLLSGKARKRNSK